MYILRSEHPGHLNVRGVVCYCVPNKGLYPLRHEMSGHAFFFLLSYEHSATRAILCFIAKP